MFDIVTNLQTLRFLYKLVRNAKLERISEEFCKIWDSCTLGNVNLLNNREFCLTGQVNNFKVISFHASMPYMGILRII